MRQPRKEVSGLCCSFCRKPQTSVSKLIANPSDYPRAYICDECIAVCAAVVEDDLGRPAHPGTPVSTAETHPLLAHPLASSLLTAVEEWIRRESLGGSAAEELAEVRRVAIEMMG